MLVVVNNLIVMINHHDGQWTFMADQCGSKLRLDLRPFTARPQLAMMKIINGDRTYGISESCS